MYFIDIVNFTQTPEAVVSGGNMTFNCHAIGGVAEWRVDDVPKDDSELQNGFTISTDYNRDVTPGPRWLLTLTMQGDANNGVRITCFVGSTQYTGHSDIQHKYFRVAGGCGLLLIATTNYFTAK